MDYVLGPAVSPLDWLEYGTQAPGIRLTALFAAVSGIAVGGLILLAWRLRRRARLVLP